MACIHELDNNVVDCVIYNTQLNCIINFDLLDDHKPDSDHKSLSLILNLGIHTNHIQKNGESQRHIHFNKSNMGLVLKELTRDLGFSTYNDNNDHIY